MRTSTPTASASPAHARDGADRRPAGACAILFQPHVGPFDRGMLSTVYCRPKAEVKSDQLLSLYADFYKREHFVQVGKTAPAIKDVTATNYCHLFPTVVKDTVVVFSAIDNLTKGASGQAIQNMNILFGLEETTGLK
jgi:N-acetyl-gamma-glutamyl-phosphate reductase